MLHIPVQLQFLQLSIQLQQWQHNCGNNDQFAVFKVNKLVIKRTLNALPFMSFFFLGWFSRCSLKHRNANIRYLSFLTNLWMCFKKEKKIQTTYSINVKYKKNVTWNTVMKKWLQSECESNSWHYSQNSKWSTLHTHYSEAYFPTHLILHES